MATNSDFLGDSPPESPVAGRKNNEQSGDPSCCPPEYEISEPEDTESDFGEEQPVKKRERGTWEIVKEWDTRVMDKADIDKEALELSDHYMRISGTKELPGHFKQNSARIGKWPRKSNLTKKKGTVVVSLALNFYVIIFCLIFNSVI